MELGGEDGKLSVWVCREEKLVSGVTRRTTCGDVVQVKAVGNKGCCSTSLRILVYYIKIQQIDKTKLCCEEVYFSIKG